jgi:hypothetical protein
MAVIDAGALEAWVDYDFPQFSQALEQIGEAMHSRGTFVGLVNSFIPFLMEEPGGAIESLVGKDIGAMSGQWIFGQTPAVTLWMLSWIWVWFIIGIGSVEAYPLWCDSDGTPYSGAMLDADIPYNAENVGEALASFQALAVSAKASLDGHRYKSTEPWEPPPDYDIGASLTDTAWAEVFDYSYSWNTTPNWATPFRQEDAPSADFSRRRFYGPSATIQGSCWGATFEETYEVVDDYPAGYTRYFSLVGQYYLTGMDRYGGCVANTTFRITVTGAITASAEFTLTPDIDGEFWFDGVFNLDYSYTGAKTGTITVKYEVDTSGWSISVPGEEHATNGGNISAMCARQGYGPTMSAEP